MAEGDLCSISELHARISLAAQSDTLAQNFPARRLTWLAVGVQVYFEQAIQLGMAMFEASGGIFADRLIPTRIQADQKIDRASQTMEAVNQSKRDELIGPS